MENTSDESMHCEPTPAEPMFSRTSSFNFCKELVGVPKTATINRSMREIIFDDTDPIPVLRYPRKKIEDVFETRKLKELNRQYFERKQAGDHEKMHKIRHTFIKSLLEGLAEVHTA